jgi:antitoxin component YwqK of YwqJK toxin-antitoxin module
MKVILILFVLIGILNANQQYRLDDVVENSNTNVWTEKSTNRIANGFVYGVMENGLSKKFTLENGKIVGFYEVYSDEGPFQTARYVNGLRNGVSLWYSESVPYQLEIKENFVNGLKEGKSYTYYNKGGKLDSELFYKNGKKDGIQKYFYESGNLKRLRKYKNGIQISETYFYESGEKAGEAKFSNSTKMIGKILYKNGNIKSKFNINMKNDSGKVMTYHKNKSKEYDILIESDDEFTGYEYRNNKKHLMNYAQIYNYLNSREWRKGEK